MSDQYFDHCVGVWEGSSEEERTTLIQNIDEIPYTPEFAPYRALAEQAALAEYDATVAQVAGITAPRLTRRLSTARQPSPSTTAGRGSRLLLVTSGRSSSGATMRSRRWA